MHRYLHWRDQTIQWLRQVWAADLKSVIQHLDEPYPHIHFIAVPNSSARRLRISSIHPGHRASEKIAEAGGSSRDERKAYKHAMISLQDDLYERVSVRFGLLRTGPRRQRLTREELNERKRQAEALAQAHVNVQALANNVRAIAKDHIRAKKAETNAAAQAKIDETTARMNHEAMALKERAIARINNLKDRVTVLDDAIFEKEAIIEAQAADLASILNILRENGLSPNLGL